MIDLDNQAQSILTCFDKENEESKGKYRVRLNASIDVARFLLKEGMLFRGHDESETSARRGNFLDLLKWEMLRDDQAEKLKKLLVLGEVHTGSGLNQELGLQRAGDTRWRSHFKTLNNRFDKVNADLLLGMATLSPDNSFANYDKERIMKLDTHYRVFMLEDLSFELDNYIDYV
ncbi:uncharacterized protein LOC132639748 [Lycium barbarum]|uniref:uncharacterized protein LOC132639748 n=1 Tax=Lycium barbarum TaxID=112863 RepID=UPI00293F0508|nr:uncharacterized protein LOC132639748 [Lycium barbarum]